MEYGNAKWNSLIPQKKENKYLDESYQIILDNPNASFSLLSKYIIHGSTVLDIGCSDGKWGKFLKELDCNVWGVDIDQEAIHYLQSLNLYEKLICCNLENTKEFCLHFPSEQLFDSIGCFDVLEHTNNPTAALMNLLPLLKVNGTLLVSVPNISNADIFLNLMCGRFNYSEKGILDNTHNKFFTKYSFLQWISDINKILPYSLDCQYIGGTFGYTDYLKSVQEKYPELYSLIQMNSEFNVVQLLFVLTKKEKTTELSYIEELNQSFYDNVLDSFNTELKKDSHLRQLLLKSNISNNEREDYLRRISILEKENQNIHQSTSYKQILSLEKEKETYAQKLDEANKNWSQCAKELDHANREWSQCAKQLDEANKRWNQCAEQLNEANKNWNQCAKELDHANREWSQCAKQLDEANRGWNQCAEQLDKANKNWSQCAVQLDAANQHIKKIEAEKDSISVNLEEIKEAKQVLLQLLQEERQRLEKEIQTKQELQNELSEIKNSKWWKLTHH